METRLEEQDNFSHKNLHKQKTAQGQIYKIKLVGIRNDRMDRCITLLKEKSVTLADAETNRCSITDDQTELGA
jgi:hypothetical protein